MAISNQTRNRSFRGGGAMYLRDKSDAASGFFQVGNADSLAFAIAEEKQSQRNYTLKGGGNIASDSVIGEVTASINVLSINPRIAAVALRALVTTIASTTISAEPHTAYLDMFIPFNFLPDFDETLTVTNDGGTITYVEGTDFSIKNNGIFIKSDSTMTNGLAILLTYTSKDEYSIDTITKPSAEYEMFFDGFNEADGGKSVAIKCHKISFSPTQALSLITEDFAALPLDFEVLADSDKNGTTESQYFVVQMEQ